MASQTWAKKAPKDFFDINIERLNPKAMVEVRIAKNKRALVLNLMLAATNGSGDRPEILEGDEYFTIKVPAEKAHAIVDNLGNRKYSLVAKGNEAILELTR